MRLMSWLYSTSAFSALALPLALRQAHTPLLEGRDDRTIVNPETGHLIVVGESSSARTIYTVVSSVCLIVLSLFLGYRAKTLKNNALRKVNFTSILILMMFFYGLAFIICVSVVQTGMGLSTHIQCYSAAIICLVFYTGNKLTIYLFLLERARIVRAPFMLRQKDWLWLIGILIIVGGFGTIAIIGYMSPIVDLSKIDGRCRIGLPPKVSFPLLSFDVGVNFLLTGVFIWLLRPVLSVQGGSWIAGVFGAKITTLKRVFRKSDESRENAEADGRLHLRVIKKCINTLLWKSLIGSTLIMLPTVGNMAQFYIMKGRELGWICLTICTLDVSWGILVINWLTIGSAEAEKSLNESVMTMRGAAGSDGDPPFPNRMGRARENSATTTEALLQAPKRAAVVGGGGSGVFEKSMEKLARTMGVP